MPVETDILPPRYRDPERIARGGMGEIYRATDTTLGRTVAVKLLGAHFAQDEGLRARFTREALTAAQLSGRPEVVTIFDVGEHRGRPFIVMEYLSGGSLRDALEREGPPEPARALAWLEQAAVAVDAAHAAGIVHRDVKPANLLLDEGGDVHVADFGIASAAGMTSMTMTGTVLGTAGYLAPEQARGERATSASDRYAFAVLAFELLTGTRPFEADTPTAEASAHVHADVPSASARRRGLPREVDAVFRRGLAKDPAARYASCAELVADLRDALFRAAGRTRATAPVAPPPRRRTQWAPVAAAAIALLALAGIAAAVLLAGGDGEAEPAAQPEPRPTTVVETRTQPGTTVVETQTVTTPAEDEPAPPAETQASEQPPGEGASGAELNERGFALMQQGRYADALPLLEEAVQKLSGSGELAEAYALYNLARTMLELGRCDASIPGMLDRSQAIQGERREIGQAGARYEQTCA